MKVLSVDVEATGAKLAEPVEVETTSYQSCYQGINVRSRLPVNGILEPCELGFGEPPDLPIELRGGTLLGEVEVARNPADSIARVPPVFSFEGYEHGVSLDAQSRPYRQRAPSLPVGHGGHGSASTSRDATPKTDSPAGWSLFITRSHVLAALTRGWQCATLPIGAKRRRFAEKERPISGVTLHVACRWARWCDDGERSCA